MLCPHCGPKGHLEQVSFSSEYERFFCSTCGNTYVSYSLGDGQFTEPIPLSTKNNPDTSTPKQI